MLKILNIKWKIKCFKSDYVCFAWVKTWSDKAYMSKLKNDHLPDAL